MCAHGQEGGRRVGDESGPGGGVCGTPAMVSQHTPPARCLLPRANVTEGDIGKGKVPQVGGDYSPKESSWGLWQT